MTFPLTPCARQHRAARWLIPAIALAISAAAHAQDDPAPSRAVAFVVTQLSTAAPHSPAVDGALIAAASSVVPPESDRAQPMPLPVRRIDIGNATQALWDMQRTSPGVRPRPIDGEQASRSYQRYLKSFDTTIPEYYESGLNLKKQ